MNTDAAQRELPLVSVLMPVREEVGFIRHSLGAVLEQSYPAARLEVIVADGGSTDGTRELVAELTAQHPNLRLIDNPGGIVPTGLNVAIRAARGEIIVRVDGHTIVAPDYVAECVAALQRTAADNVGGRMTPVGETEFGRAVALATTSPFGVGGSRFHYSDREEPVDTVYMGAWPRSTFDRFGLFNEELVRNQDDELNYRIRDAGGSIILVPRIQSTYTPRGSARALWRQYFQYGLWKVRVLQKHPSQLRASHLAPPALAAGLATTAALSPFTGRARAALGALLAAYGAATLVATMSQRRRGAGRSWRLLPAVFAILHFGYGFGFLVGLAQESRRRNQALDVN